MRSALNLVCWQCTWLTVIHSASNGLFWPGCLVFAASIAIQSTRRFGVCLPPAGLVAGVVVAGLVVDSVLMSSGLIRFPVDEGAGWPAWMALLWANFATTLDQALRWAGRRRMVGAAGGAVAGTVAYQAADSAGAIALAPGYLALLVIACLWMVAIPTLAGIARVLRSRRAAEKGASEGRGTT